MVAGKSFASQKIMHRFEKRNAHRRVLMIEQEIDFGVLIFPHADLDHVRHLEQRMESAELAEPHHQIVIKKLMADGADVNGSAVAVWIESHGGATGIEI